MDTDLITQFLDEVSVKHSEGYNCAESAFYGVCRYLGLEMPVSCMTGFGGGVARTGSVCGALSGAISGLGMYIGRTQPEEEESKARCNALGQEIVKDFTDKMGALTCRDILGFTLGSEDGPERYAKSNLKKTRCNMAIRVAVESAIRTIESDRQKG